MNTHKDKKKPVCYLQDDTIHPYILIVRSKNNFKNNLKIAHIKDFTQIIRTLLIEILKNN